MGKTRDLVKKIGDAEGTFHAKNGHNKGQEWQRTNRSRRDCEEVARIYRKTIPKKVLMIRCGHSPRAKHPGV